MAYRELTECVACGGASLQRYLDLGRQPLANAYHDGSRELPRYPLAVNRCEDCSHSQLTVAVDPRTMFDRYAYVSDVSRDFRDYLEWFAERSAPRPCRVLEFGCNTGTLLEILKRRGCECAGVDPAENLRPTSEARGLDVIVDRWGTRLLDSRPELRGAFDAVIGLNVIAHDANPLDMILAAKEALRPNGAIWLQTSCYEWVRHGQFDTVYHEHISHFTLRSLIRLAERAGLGVATELVPIHGGSLLACLYRGKHQQSAHGMLLAEYADPWVYDTMQERVDETAATVRVLVENYRLHGLRVIGYGAAAKGNTLLNYSGVKLDYIVDDGPNKVGLRTPGSNIPIVSAEVLGREPERLVVVVLPWNFRAEIRARVKSLRPTIDDVFVTYFPTVLVD
jgi:hypothetical protein